MWDEHPPFQIDGNFGATAGLAEMLLQSDNEGNITLFPAIPSKWKTVSFENLRARGNFIVSAKRVGGRITECKISARSGGKIGVKAEGLKTAIVTDACTGAKIRAKYGNGEITFNTKTGGSYIVAGFSAEKKQPDIRRLSAKFGTDGVILKWKAKGNCAVYRAVENDKEYKLLAVRENGEFTDCEFNVNNKKRLTYKVVSANGEYSQKSRGAVTFLSPASELEKERYERRLKINNMYADGWKLR